MFLEVESLKEIKKKLEKYYMVRILCALHLDFKHIRDQFLTSMETLTTHLLYVMMPQTQEAHEPVEPSVIVAR